MQQEELFMLISFSAHSSTLKMEAIYAPPQHQLTFIGLYGVISHKIELFTVTAVRTSNPTHQNFIHKEMKFGVSCV
jgi:hypothetical protein